MDKRLLTNLPTICLIDVAADEKDFAAQLFGNSTIAHDKGKPVARQGRKAKSLPAPVTSDETTRGEGRWSGRRRRSEMVSLQTPRAGVGILAGTTGLIRPRVSAGSNPSVVPFPLHSYLQSLSIEVRFAYRRKRRRSAFVTPFDAAGAVHRAPPVISISRPDAGRALQRIKAHP
jgi:hypothetical protein